jgi:enolase-phosphatase E1
MYPSFLLPIIATSYDRHPITPLINPQFPYALRVLPSTLETEWDSPSFLPYRSAFPPEHAATPNALLSHVRDLMSKDLKIAYLKSLQGYLWLRGYESGELKCPMFPDVHPALKEWNDSGIKICIYSSGSVAAQKLLFRYTTDGDLRPLIYRGLDGEGEGGYWDTVNAGSKQEKGSYAKIAGENKVLGEVGEWLFLSDNVGEVRAAREAGMTSFVVVREGNKELSEEEKEDLVLVSSFEEVGRYVELGGK